MFSFFGTFAPEDAALVKVSIHNVYCGSVLNKSAVASKPLILVWIQRPGAGQVLLHQEAGTSLQRPPATQNRDVTGMVFKLQRRSGKSAPPLTSSPAVGCCCSPVGADVQIVITRLMSHVKGCYKNLTDSRV